jgi:hypothetical protein
MFDAAVFCAWHPPGLHEFRNKIVRRALPSLPSEVLAESFKVFLTAFEGEAIEVMNLVIDLKS